jgi:uncharacterized protein (DUF924 family)
MRWQDEVLDFWFGLDPERWFVADPDLDGQVSARFRDLWEEQRLGAAADFLASPEDALAAVVLFDQMPRNMLRGHADQFATDGLALTIAKEAIEAGFDQQLESRQRGILYMPFQHSEDIEDQRRSLILFSMLGNEEQLHYARLHHDVIERFGRFPHRNEMLGRMPTPEEDAAGDVKPF